MLKKQSILKNRKIRFREADYVEKNYIRDGRAIIPIRLNSIKELYMKHMKYLFNTYGDIVDHGINVEDARFILPNACETKIVVTMNIRSLYNFFKHRMCNRAQWEIRFLAWEMWRKCMEVSPTLFKHAGPACINGKCSEGNMSCGKQLQVKNTHATECKVYDGGNVNGK